MAQQVYQWGIIGTGRIAGLFAEGLGSLEQAQCYAVGSRSRQSAENFAHRWGFRKEYGSYQALFDDPRVDIVYIATPHSFHYENVRDALLAEKHVLCEKPFTLNAGEARDLIDLAREKRLFLMDAMWNRFQPWFYEFKRLIHKNILGELHHFKADLSFSFLFDPEHRLFNPTLGGGALLDLGVYPLALASLVFGKPQTVLSHVHLCDTGVDDQMSMMFQYASGATAQLGCASRYSSKSNAILHGSKGFLEIRGLIIRPQQLSLHLNGESPRTINTPTAVNGYQYEAQAVMDMLAQGQLEHPNMPLDETLDIMGTMDLIRHQAGIRYPSEK